MTLSENVITEYIGFVSISVETLIPIVGITAGVFLAFTIFERVVRVIVKTIK